MDPVRQPTLILMEQDDPLMPPINDRILARLIPKARLQLVDHGHLFMVTRPVETARMIEAFLAERWALIDRCGAVSSANQQFGFLEPYRIRVVRGLTDGALSADQNEPRSRPYSSLPSRTPRNVWLPRE